MQRSLALVVVMGCAHLALADTVTLNNGDKITGTIEELNATSVVIQTPYAGRLTVERAAVKTLQSDKAVTVVRSATDRPQLFLSPAASGTGWQETPSAPPPPPPGPPRHTNYLSLSPLWQNQLSIGVVNTTGNDESTSFSGSLLFHYQNKPDELTFKLDGAYGLSNGNQTAGLFSQTAVLRRDIDDRTFLYLGDDIRYDAIKGISLLATGTAGMGFWLVRDDKFKLDVRGGPGVSYLKTFDSEEDTSVIAEAAIRASYVFNERVSATHETVYNTSLCDFDVWRIHSESALLVKLDLERGLGLKLSFIDDYENRPAAGRKNNDTRAMLSLTLDF